MSYCTTLCEAEDTFFVEVVLLEVVDLLPLPASVCPRTSSGHFSKCADKVDVRRHPTRQVAPPGRDRVAQPPHRHGARAGVRREGCREEGREEGGRSHGRALAGGSKVETAK